jgi:predicted amidophosphoribosyltransferase
MNCSKCGFNNPEGMRFCGQCAAPLQQTCPACGWANPPDFSYCGHCAGRLDGTAAEPAQRTKDAERRQLTVLFCDIIGSSTLSENLDPEELRDIIYQYRSVCSEINSGYGGHIAQYLGDGILV